MSPESRVQSSDPQSRYDPRMNPTIGSEPYSMDYVEALTKFKLEWGGAFHTYTAVHQDPAHVYWWDGKIVSDESEQLDFAEFDQS